ncbi:FAD-dependent oxidoreductase [Mycobacterium vicinigordonae]|uniref:ferredoxin--NADP(+) reductase n=1 Tax=Mycobacterium vicinigordonae TaxID=1719132 RepID=A0A7D6HXA0_9MYCO|nr:FAD-dependent oxidoreductase [Mycobacterium vicinigordonae]QLL09812.1 FAD-dependent oxidoreductase [Mycobacterium vicinigordonae]
MTVRVVIVGAGPAGFAVASALLTAAESDIRIELVERTARPDGLLRHGPAAGTQRLREVASEVDAVLADSRVSFRGNVVVGAALTLDEVRTAAHAVVLATGAPADLPMEIAGDDSVGIGTISHVEAWLADSADVATDELDLDMDTAVLIGISDETVRVAEALCGRLRHVQLVDARPQAEIDLPEDAPANLVIRTALTPVGVVGRSRARALRCIHAPDRYGRVVSEDLRAQLLLRPRANSLCWPGIDEDDGHIASHKGRVLSGGTPVVGLYAAGWAARAPDAKGSHADDAATVVAALRADHVALPEPSVGLADLLRRCGIVASTVHGWSALAATNALLARFTGEGTAPLADYSALIAQVDED